MSWTIDRIKGELQKLCAADHIALDVPVNINSRITRTLGRVKYNYYNGAYYPTTIEFSQKFLVNGTDNDIINVIKHEYVHFFLLAIEPCEKPGHDAAFKRKCVEIGCTHIHAQNHLENCAADTAIEAKSKYEVWCDDCDEIISTYARKCKTLNNIAYCTCGRCGSKNLRVVQNW